MFDATPDLYFSLVFAALAIVAGLASLGFGHTGMGGMWPHPRIFWGWLGACFVLVGLGVGLMGLEYETSARPGHDLRALLGEGVGLYLLMFALLLMAMWGTWAYLEQYLYTVNRVNVPDVKFELVRKSRLRRRNIGMAATMWASAAALVAATILYALLLNLAVSFAIGCIIGGATFILAFAALTRLFRRDLSAE